MLLKGTLQIRQFEGNRTQNKPSAAVLTALCARLRSVLLKTSLPLALGLRWDKYSYLARLDATRRRHQGPWPRVIGVIKAGALHRPFIVNFQDVLSIPDE